LILSLKGEGKFGVDFETLPPLPCGERIEVRGLIASYFCSD
jgi:hypothetical protein